MALATAEHDGAFVHWVHATRSAARVPLGAFAGILAPDRGSDDLLELMRQSAGVLRTRAGDRAIVLGVDDAQLLDASSAALVLHLAVSSTAFVVATLRTGEPCEDAIAALSKDAGALRIELRPLDEAETGKLVESALGGLVEEGARRWVVDRSDGNPLYVRELLLGALGSGDLVQIGGLWQLAGRPAMSVSLGQLVETRMAALGRSERQAVELVAFGEPLPLPLVVELANPEAVAAAESHGMLVVDGGREGGTIRLAHPIYGEVVRASLPAAWARELRIRLASIVQATGPAGAEDSLRVARWLLDAGEVIPVGLLVSAANAALRAGDPNLGAELAGLAVDGGGGVEASLLLIRAHTRRRRFQEAELILERIEEPFESQELALDYLEQCISVRFWGLRRPEELSVLLERAAGWWSDDSWRERLQPLRLYAAPVGEVFGGNVDETAGILARPTLDRAVRRQLEPLHVAHLFYTGRTQEAHDLALRIRPSVPFSRQTDERALGLWAKVAIETGRDWPGLEAWMGEALGVAVRIGDQAAAGIASLTLGRLRILDGRFGEAARWLAEAEYCFEKQDTFGSLVTARSMQVVVACRTGELRQIAPALERCHAALGGHAPFPNQLPYLVRADAWSAWALGDRSAAQEQLLQGSDQTSSSPIHSAMLAYDAMRAGIPARRVTSRLTELADRCDAPLLSAYAAQAAATVAEDGVAVLTVADEMARIGALRYAMEAAAGAAGIFAREGRHDSARRAAAQSLAIFEQGDGGIPPAIDGMTADVRLTSREKQLVDLARQGLTNSDIATRLVLSVRTVESHLYRAMQKLGIKDRRDL
ncbi:MAG TPA: LuxR C-terminal-related transcriptional regulator [Gaiellaceae bacterium]|jgi:DNA-binding NarL/FixJ family response regulator|nr:LuxR C-terminal-related transcriptional regulator [Gaiellaceae bacterium]